MQRTVSACLVLLGFLIIAVGWVLAAINGPIADVGSTGGFLTVLELVFLVAGAMITRRLPGRWTGPLVQLVTLATVNATTRLGNLGSASAFEGAVWLATILLPAVLVLDHPDGIRERWLRRSLGVGIAVTAALAVPVVLVAHGSRDAGSTWWWTPTPHEASALARTLFEVHALVTAATLSIVLVVMARRLSRADRALRHVLNPVWIPGLVWALTTAAGQLARFAGEGWALDVSGHDSYSFTVSAEFLLIVLPLLAVTALLGGVVWIQLVVPRMKRTTSGMAVDGSYDPNEVTRYLSWALGDPSATLVYATSDGTSWIDSRGQPVSISVDTDRAMMVLRRNGAALGAIIFDAAMAAELDALELGATAAAFAIDSARLVALANAAAESSRRLTARLLTAGEVARLDLREQLLGGPLRELGEIDDELERGADAHGVARRLQAVTAEVRRISHGVFPAELSTGGLAAALPGISSPNSRFAPAIEVTAYLAAEGDAGARIGEEVDRLRIELSEPPTSATLLDRVTVLGGTIEGRTILLPVVG
jgi:hypothetical protein